MSFDKNGKQSVANDDELETFVLNIYNVLMLRGIKGTYVYACNDDLRDYFADYITKYREVQKVISPIRSKLITADSGLPIFDFGTDYGQVVESQNKSFKT